MIDRSSIKITPTKESKYIQINTMTYVQNGKEKSWDVTTSYDSVATLILNTDLNKLIVVRQFRPALFLRDGIGIMYELCAGLVDKNKSLEEIALEEIEEECGYKTNNIKKITDFYSSVGTSANKQTLYFSKVKNSEKIGNGGGVANESVEPLYLDLSEALELINCSTITPALGYCILWFARNEANHV